MIESCMYVSIGVLFGWLSAIAFVPVIQNRTMRLAVRRMEGRLPQSMTQIRADKDLLRAEFAMSTRRMEMTIEQLRNQMTNQASELGENRDTINLLNAERNELKTEAKNLKEMRSVSSEAERQS
jgi:methyl-accepting chemotaxis protein